MEKKMRFINFLFLVMLIALCGLLGACSDTPPDTPDDITQNDTADINTDNFNAQQEQTLIEIDTRLNDVKLLISTNGMTMPTSTLKNLNSAKENAHLLIYDKAKTKDDLTNILQWASLSFLQEYYNCALKHYAILYNNLIQLKDDFEAERQAIDNKINENYSNYIIEQRYLAEELARQGLDINSGYGAQRKKELYQSYQKKNSELVKQSNKLESNYQNYLKDVKATDDQITKTEEKLKQCKRDLAKYQEIIDKM